MSCFHQVLKCFLRRFQKCPWGRDVLSHFKLYLESFFNDLMTFHVSHYLTRKWSSWNQSLLWEYPGLTKAYRNYFSPKVGETRSPGHIPRKHGENMHTPHRTALPGFKLKILLLWGNTDPPCCQRFFRDFARWHCNTHLFEPPASQITCVLKSSASS